MPPLQRAPTIMATTARATVMPLATGTTITLATITMMARGCITGASIATTMPGKTDKSPAQGRLSLFSAEAFSTWQLLFNCLKLTSIRNCPRAKSSGLKRPHKEKGRPVSRTAFPVSR